MQKTDGLAGSQMIHPTVTSAYACSGGDVYEFSGQGQEVRQVCRSISMYACGLGTCASRSVMNDKAADCMHIVQLSIRPAGVCSGKTYACFTLRTMARSVSGRLAASSQRLEYCPLSMSRPAFTMYLHLMPLKPSIASPTSGPARAWILH